jgi:nucleotide-binding universal stress UspA family protein
MIKNLLLCTDGSDYANAATEYAIWLAQKWAARLRALHVTDIRLLEGPLLADISGAIGAQPFRAFLPQLQEIYRQKAEAILGAVKDRCAKAGVTVETLHKTGGLVDAILEEERRAELVVIGQRGEHAQFVGEMLGSSVERLVRRSVKPCLVTPDKFRQIQQIVAAYDGSKESSKSLTMAFDVTRWLGASLHLITVCGPGDEARAAQTLQEAVTLAQSHGLTVNNRLAQGEADAEILKFAESENMDLIVMGAYGQTRIREWILGSVTTSVIRRSKVAVLLMR